MRQDPLKAGAKAPPSLAELAAKVMLLQMKLENREAELKVSETRVKLEQAENTKLGKALQAREDFIDKLLKQIHGPLSERRSWESLESELQLWLEGMALELPSSSPPPSDDDDDDKDGSVKDDEGKRRKKKTDVAKTGRIKHDPNATILDFDAPNPNIEGIPADELEVVETKTIQKVVRVRSPYFILRVHYKTYRQKGCLEELPPTELPEVLPDTIYDVSLIAGLAVDKYLFHLPTYRQHQAIQQSGIYIDRGQLTRVLHRAAELLEPVYEKLATSILNSKILTVDETPTPAGRKEGKMDKGYFWVFFGEQNEVHYLFSPSREGRVLKDALSMFEGTLVADGYAAYESFAKANPGVSLVQCWVHTRREFLNAEKKEPERAKWVLRQIKAMYKIEEKVKDKPPDQILDARQKKTKPIVLKLFDFLKKTIAEETFVPSDTFLKAANYALNREEYLKVFLENPDIPLDTNHVERELRGQAVGRKNWMFHVTEEGARYAAIFYSLIRSCLLVDVNPMDYLVDVLQRIDTHPSAQTELLIPRLWKEHFGEAPLRSPFHEALLPKGYLQPS
jgi:transposase